MKIKRILLLLFFAFEVVNLSFGIDNRKEEFKKESYSKVGQGVFLVNKGQVRDEKGNFRSEVLYSSMDKGVGVFYLQSGVSYVFQKQQKQTNGEEDKKSIFRLDVEFVNANKNVKIKESGKSLYPYKFHIPEHYEVEAFDTITYIGLYNNIDLQFYRDESKRLKYDFIVKPGGNLKDIKIRYKNADEINLDINGQIIIKHPFGQFVEKKPISFIGENKKSTPSKFVLFENDISFDVLHEKGKVLVIDPVLDWGTYFYSDIYTNEAQPFSVEPLIGSSEDIIVAGSLDAISNLFPHQPGLSNVPSGIGINAFAARFAGNGTLVWAMIFGGSNIECAYDLAITAGNDIWITGYTQSTNYPIVGSAIQSSLSGTSDAFVVKLAATGNILMSSYLGGTGIETGVNVTTDAQNNVVMEGVTSSTNLLSTHSSLNTTQTINGGGRDLFLVKFNGVGNIIWWRYYGGSMDEEFQTAYNSNEWTAENLDIVMGIDPVLTGTTRSNNLPLTISGSVQGFNEAFVTRFNGSDGSIVWGRFLGGASEDEGRCVEVGANNIIYVGGNTKSTNFPVTSGVYQTTKSSFGVTGFITSFNPLGAILSSTYFPGVSASLSSVDIADIEVDACGNVWCYLSCSAASNGLVNTMPVTQDAIQSSNPTCSAGASGYFCEFNSSLTSLLYGSHMAGEVAMGVTQMAILPSGAMYFTGWTNGAMDDFIVGGYQTTFYGDDPNFPCLGTILNGYIIKVSNELSTSWSVSSENSGGYDFANDITSDKAGNIYVTGTYTVSTEFPAPCGNIVISSNTPKTHAYVAKYNACGELQWINFDSRDGSSEGNGIAIDPVNNKVYVTGYTGGVFGFQSTATIPCVAYPVPAPLISGGAGYYVASFDMDNGAQKDVFVRSSPTNISYQSYSVTVGASSSGTTNVYIGGYSTTNTVSPIATIPMLDKIVSANPGMTLNWSKIAANPAAGTVSFIRDICFNPVSNAVFVTGEFQNTLTFTGLFGGNQTVSNTVAVKDAFICAFGAGALPIPVAASLKKGNVASGQQASGYSVDIDETGNIYYAGEYTGNFNTSRLLFEMSGGILTGSNGQFSGYVVKSTGNTSISWVRRLQTSVTTGNAKSRGISVVGENVFISGIFNRTNVTSGGGMFFPANGNYVSGTIGLYKSFVASLSKNTGVINWGNVTQAAANYSEHKTMAVTSDGTYAYITGGYIGELDYAYYDFGLSSLVSSPINTANTFILRSYGVNNGEFKHQEFIDEEAGEYGLYDIKIYPNPTDGIFNIDIPEEMMDATLTIYDFTGKIIEIKSLGNNASQEINLGEQATGVYIIVLSNGEKVMKEKIIKR